MKVVGLLLLPLACVSTSPGNGIAKSTYAVSDALTSGKWLEKYLPVEEASGCANNVCTCGTQGRVQLSTSDGSKGFGIHTVWAPGQDNTRAAANGGKTLKQIEAIWAQGIGQLKDTYNKNVNTMGWTDNALTLRASGSLDGYVTSFTQGGENFVTGTVTADGETLYTVIVHIPNTQVVLEIQSTACSKCSSKSLGHRAATHQNTETRLRTSFPPSPSPSGNTLAPVKISRAVTSVDAVTKFYKQVFKINPQASSAGEDGTKIVAFKVQQSETVSLQFVERAGQTGQYNSQWFASYMNATNHKYMGTDYKGCWDIWGDNHCAYDRAAETTDVYWQRWKQTGYPLWMHSTPGGVHMYGQDPSGWQIQFDGTFNNPPSDVFPRAQQNCYACCKGVTEEIVV